ncbi:D-glucuronyl C5-epimerase family protein [Streptomyces sp. NPDC059828]|uniref:D-glucuronyl C5-epimerase family protein n=1 Tax=Streptomyces sp. NPDC059828 TaxID=3346965 RepID=UPI003656C1C4
MAGKRRADIGRRRFIRLAGGGAAGVAVAGGGTFTAMATGVFDEPQPDLFARMPRSLALSLPQTPAEAVPLPPLPDPLEGGTATINPARRIPYADSRPNTRAVEKDVPTTLPFAFKRDGFKIVEDLPEALRPWRNRPTLWANLSPSTGEYHLNSQGVYMKYPRKASGGYSSVGYDHPVGQIQFGLGCIASYRNESDPTRKALFLKRAKAQADRLIEKRVETRGAWYFPYPWDYSHEVHSGVSYKAPWYSGMAQGEAISLFAQLAQLDGITEKERTLYKGAADGAFASLLRADNAYPWVVAKDRAGYVWIHEYPFKTPGTGDFTYNGMIFAMFGIWDYFQLTGSELAQELYDGCCTTIARYFSLLRNPRWFSYYCQAHRIPASTYHHHHITLWQQLHWHTNSKRFANQLDQLVDDFPSPGVQAGATIAIAKGSHTLYKLDTKVVEVTQNGKKVKVDTGDWYENEKTGAGKDKILSRKSVTFSRATQAPVDKRRRIQGAGIWYRISAGAYKGLWIGESWPNVFLRGEHLAFTYRVERTLTFRTGTDITLFKFGPDGVAGTMKTKRYTTEQTATFDRRSVVNGRPMCRISAGEFAGQWVPANQVIADGV